MWDKFMALPKPAKIVIGFVVFAIFLGIIGQV